MRIAIIGAKNIPATRGGGGIERHIEELGPRLVGQGHDVTVYIRSRFFEAPGYRGILLEPVSSIFTKHLDTITYTFVATLRVVVKEFDIIHYHGIGPATLAWIPRVFKPKCKVVVTFHSLDRFHQKWGLLARLFLRFAEFTAVKFPHATIAVSRSIKEYCKVHFKKDIFYIPNGANIKPYPGDDLLEDFGLEKNKYILTTGRFVPQKGIHYLIEAYKGLETDKKLVIAGGGETEGDYEDYIRKLAKGNSNIVFTGFQNITVLDQLYAGCYLYVHPSEAEGLSMSILEAMAAGRCTFVSDIPENIELIDNAGFTFYNTDTQDLKEKLQELFNHPDIVADCAERARKRMEEEYDWGEIVEKTEEVYKS